MDHWLIVLHEGQERRFRLDRPSSLLGQATDCDVRLIDPTVSRRHARISRAGDDWLFEDLGSTNGSFVDGQRIEQARVAVGQPLRLGDVLARIEAAARDDLALRIDLPPTSTPASPQQTQLGAASARFLLTELPRLLRAARAGASTGELARLAVAAAECAYPGLGLSIERRSDEENALLAGDLEDTDARLALDPFLFRWRTHQAPLEAAAILGLVAELLRLATEAPNLAAGPTPIEPPSPPDPPSRDRSVQTLYRDAARVAPARDIQVLIEGESGTGKELLAGYLHQASGATGALVALNCAALPRDLLEAELFGIERGVATGVEARVGCFERADGGTLFLDEVGDMAAEVQAKLLRVLQQGQVLRVGGSTPRPVDVRIVSATNRDLLALVEAGQFRLDLYHRIADWRVRLPALRERPADLLGLAAHFLEQACRKRGLSAVGLSQDAARALRSWHWPGNVRELEREMRRAALFLENGQVLDVGQLSDHIRLASAGGRESALDEGQLQQAIADADGNMSAAAQRLGVARSTLYRRLKALGLEPGER
ncbi:MAG: sigma 54-interacting transcriptional regulator [Lysobacterales bacterium]